MFTSILQTAADGSAVLTLPTVLAIILATLICGIIISIFYMVTEKGSYSSPFVITMVVLPIVIAVIVIIIGSNIARAFSIAGAFSIIRFRSTPGNPKDITYILFSLAVGLACAVGYIFFAFIFTLIVCAILYILDKVNFGVPKSTNNILKIVIPEDLDYQGVFDGVLRRYTSNYQLTKVKTTDLGSLFELVYNVTIEDTVNQKKFIDDLRCRNGNLTVTLVLNSTPNEF